MKVQCHCSWQAQHLVTSKGRFRRSSDVQVSLFVAGTALGECLNVRLGAKRFFFIENARGEPEK